MSEPNKTHVVHVARPSEPTRVSPFAQVMRHSLSSTKTQRIVVIILMLSIVFAAFRHVRQQQAAAQDAAIRQQIASPPTPTPGTAKKPTKSISLDGQYTCRTGTMYAVFSRGRASLAYASEASATTSAALPRKDGHMLFDGDCVYSWSDIAPEAAVKRCGLKSYLSTYQSVASYTGGADVNGVISILENMGVMGGEDVARAETALRACQEAAKVDEGVFAVPKTIQFKEQK